MDIVTITLNPALDLTARLEAMTLGEVNLVSDANLDQRFFGYSRKFRFREEWYNGRDRVSIFQ